MYFTDNVENSSIHKDKCILFIKLTFININVNSVVPK